MKRTPVMHKNAFLNYNSTVCYACVLSQLECVDHRVPRHVLSGNLVSRLRFQASSICFYLLSTVVYNPRLQLIMDQILQMSTQHNIGQKCFIVKQGFYKVRDIQKVFFKPLESILFLFGIATRFQRSFWFSC